MPVKLFIIVNRNTDEVCIGYRYEHGYERH